MVTLFQSDMRMQQKSGEYKTVASECMHQTQGKFTFFFANTNKTSASVITLFSYCSAAESNK